MNTGPEITMSTPQGLGIVLTVVLVFLAIRLLPRLLVGWRAYVSPQEVKRRMDAKERVLLLDVRSAGEFRGDLGHVPGALNVPLNELKGRLEHPDFLSAWRDSPVVAICRSDSRAAFAVRLLKRAGFAPVLVMSGGMAAWGDEAFPVERGGRNGDSL